MATRAKLISADGAQTTFYDSPEEAAADLGMSPSAFIALATQNYEDGNGQLPDGRMARLYNTKGDPKTFLTIKLDNETLVRLRAKTRSTAESYVRQLIERDLTEAAK